MSPLLLALVNGGCKLYSLMARHVNLTVYNAAFAIEHHLAHRELSHFRRKSFSQLLTGTMDDINHPRAGIGFILMTPKQIIRMYPGWSVRWEIAKIIG